MATKKNGKVFLVGVGPGNEGLVTKAALDCIAKADVIIYDHLISSVILDVARKDAMLIYAGKSPGKHSFRQEQINRLLITKAKENNIVVRLKGGDPFLFGRGSEEALVLLREKISFEIIPGVSSGVAVAAYAGIPLTHRGISSQVTFVTGHEDPKKIKAAVDWAKLAKTEGTLVIFMGMNKLEAIISELIKHGMKKNTPVCVSQWGTLPSQNSTSGTLKSIIKKINARKITNPAIVIIGEVVRLREKLNWYESKPLFGKKILVTRPIALAKEFSLKLRQHGAQTYNYPLIEIIRQKGIRSQNLINKIKISDWVVFTSRSAVDICFDLLNKKNKDVRIFSKAKVAVLGQETKNSLKKKGIVADLMPKKFFMEGLIDEFKKKDIKGKRIFIPHSKQARKVLTQGLSLQGAIIEELFIYQVKAPKGANKKQLKNMILNENFDLITFTSSSCVHQFMRFLKGEEKILKKQKFAVIGPITEETLNNYGYRSQIIAETFTVDGLIEAIMKKLRTIE